MAEWVEIVFGIETYLSLSYTVLERNAGTCKNKALPSGTLSHTLELEKFCKKKTK